MMKRWNCDIFIFDSLTMWWFELIWYVTNTSNIELTLQTVQTFSNSSNQWINWIKHVTATYNVHHPINNFKLSQNHSIEPIWTDLKHNHEPLPITTFQTLSKSLNSVNNSILTRNRDIQRSSKRSTSSIHQFIQHSSITLKSTTKIKKINTWKYERICSLH